MSTRPGRSSTMLQLAAVAVLSLSAASAGAQSLSGNLTVDNAFTAFLSTSATALGTPVATGVNWPTPVSFGPVSLTPGQNYWLQVVADNQGGPGALIGTFTLTGGFNF